jgi:hypothetical protein
MQRQRCSGKTRWTETPSPFNPRALIAEHLLFEARRADAPRQVYSFSTEGKPEPAYAGAGSLCASAIATPRRSGPHRTIKTITTTTVPTTLAIASP